MFDLIQIKHHVAIAQENLTNHIIYIVLLFFMELFHLIHVCDKLILAFVIMQCWYAIIQPRTHVSHTIIHYLNSTH